MVSSALWILVAMAAYGIVHSILASLRAKALAREWFGPPALRVYRLAYNMFAVVSLLPVLALVPLLPDRELYRVPAPWVSLTLVGQALAAGMLVVSLLRTGLSSFLGVRQLVSGSEERGGALVVTGLYRWVRHPLYTAGLIFIWLSPVMTVNLLALYAGFTLYIVVGALFEERKLVKEFGRAYTRYRQKTPMLFPIHFGRKR